MNIKSLLALAQKLVAADKAVVVGLLVQAVMALALAFGLHANAQVVAVASTIANVAVSYFLHRDFKAKLAAAKLH